MANARKVIVKSDPIAEEPSPTSAIERATAPPVHRAKIVQPTTPQPIVMSAKELNAQTEAVVKEPEPEPEPEPEIKPEAQAPPAEAQPPVIDPKAIQKLVNAKTYFLPINAVERRRTRRFVALGLLLSAVLLVAWIDIALDAGLLSVGGIHAPTHFFSS